MDPDFLQTCFSWPVLPFSVILALTMIYWLLVIVGGIGMDILDLDLDLDGDFDADLHGSLADWGMVGVRWFNLGDVPLMVWMTVFALTSWWVTITFNRDIESATTWETVGLFARNIGIGLLAAKLLTQPLKGKLKHKEPNTLADLIGRRCVVKSSEVTDKFGQIECATDEGAPLYLNAITAEGSIPRGETVEIIDFSPATRLYSVRQIPT